MKQLMKQFPALAKANSWFHGLPKRDQNSLKVLSVAVAIFLVYFLIWQPVQNSLQTAKTAADQSYNDLVWLKENEGKARALAGQRPATSQPQVSGQSLLSTVSSSAKKFQVELQRFEPRGDTKVNVWLDKVSFNQMMLWLGDLDKNYGVKVEQVNIDKSDRPGEVTARLSLTI